MTFPKKKSRLIKVDGKNYRWMIGKGYPRWRGAEKPTLRIIVEDPSTSDLFEAHLVAKQWLIIEEVDGSGEYVVKAKLGPGDVKKLIRKAVKNGWGGSQYVKYPLQLSGRIPLKDFRVL